MSWSASTSKNTNSGAQGLTPQTQALLNEMMSKRGTSLRAAQDIQESIQRGDNKWIESLNTNSAAPRASTSKTKPLVKAPKVGRGAGPPIALPGRFSGIKLKHEIERDSPAVREQYQGAGPGPNREAEKDRLSAVMEHGAKGAQELERRMAEMKRAALQRKAQNSAIDVKEAKIDQIIDEMRERREFLESMRAVGKAAQYERQIRSEIRQRMYELESLGVAGATPPPVPRLLDDGPLG